MKLKRILLSGMAAILAAATTASSMDLNGLISEEVSVKKYAAATSGVNVVNRTQDEIREYVKNHPTDVNDRETNIFSKAPDYETPFDDPGALSEKALSDDLNALNAIRYAAGLSEVSLDSAAAYGSQCVAYVAKVGDSMYITNQKPDGINDTVYETAKQAYTNGISFWNYWNMPAGLQLGIIGAGGDNEKDTLSLRRRLLDPALSQVGFGQSGYGTDSKPYYFVNTKTLSSAVSGTSGVCWPAQNTPITYFNAGFPWSYSYGQSITNTAGVKVTLTRTSDGKVWNFASDTTENGPMYVSNTNSGLRGCVIFYPKDITYNALDTFTVKITGIGNETINYTVNFFNLDASTDPVADVTGFKLDEITATTAKLSWDKHPNAAKFHVNVMNMVQGSVADVETADTSCTITGLTQDTTYYFSISAQRADGKYSSGMVQISGTTLNDPNAKTPPVTNLKASKVTESSVQLVWDNSSADNYTIYMWENGDWKYLDDTIGAGYNKTGLKSETTYKFQVTASKSGNVSDPVELEVTTTAAPPAAISGLTATPSSTGVVLKWNSSPTADSYQVEMINGSTWEKLGITSELTYTVNNLKPGTLYNFRVYSINKGIYSKSAPEKTATTTIDTVAPVTNLKATTTVNSVSLTWTASASAKSYQVKMQEGSGNWTSVTTTASTTYTVTGLKSGTSYNFRVTALNGTVKSSPVTVKATTTEEVKTPAAVTNLKATATVNSVSLSWNASANAKTYQIEMQEGSGNWTSVTTTASTTYTVTGLKSGTSYNFRVTAINDSVKSSPVSVKATTDEETLASVTGLNATATANSVTLTWNKVTNATGYIVEMQNGSSWSNIGTVTTTTFTKSGLAENTTYKFRVTATKSNLQSSSVEIPATTSVEPVGSVTGLNATATANSVTLTWNKVTNATGYTIEWFSGGSWSKIGTVTTTTFTKSGLTENTTYRFRVTATKTNAQSSPVEIPATTSVEPVGSVTGLNATATANSVTLTWNKVTNATGYIVEMQNGNSWSKIGTVTTTTYTKSGLAENTTYKFRVTATKTNAQSSPIEISATTATVPVGEVKGLKATTTADSVTLTWDKATNAAGYTIEWFSGGSWSEIGKVTATTFTKSGLAENTTYKFRVTATKANAQSSPIEISATTAIVPVSAVTGLKASQTTNSVTLTWNTVSSASKYRVEIFQNGQWSSCGEVTVNSYTKNGLSAGTTYKFRVYALRNDILSQPVEITAVTNSEQVSAVTGLTASTTETSVSVTWNKLDGADSYRVEVKQNDTVIANETVTDAAFSKDSLTPGTSYVFTVYALKNGVLSDPASITAVTKEETVNAVTNLNTTVTTDSVTLTWNKADGAAGYRVEMLQNGEWSVISTVTDTTYTKNDLTPATPYEFRVCAFKNTAVSEYEKITAVTNNETVGAVTGLNTSVTTNSVTLTWNKADGAAGYRVEMLQNGNWSVISTTTDTTYTKTGLIPATPYEFRVCAFKNTAVSEYEKITAVTNNETVGAVTGLNTTVTTNSVKLTWNKADGAAGYRVEMLQNGEWSVISTVTDTTYTKNGLTPATSYDFRVCAVKNTVVSEYATITAVTNSESVKSVDNLKAKVTVDSVTLNWDKVAGATGYQVDMFLNNAWTTLGTTTETTFNKTGLTPNTPYEIRVFTLKNKSRSYAARISVVTDNDGGASAAGLKTVVTSMSVKLTWNNNPNADSYRIDMCTNGYWSICAQVTGTTYTVNDLKPNTSYTFRLYPIKNNVRGDYVEIKVTTGGNTATPTKVSNFNAKASSNSVTLTWSKNATADKYRVYIYKGGKWVRLTETTKLTYTVNSLNPNTKYNFRVFAVKGNVYGAYTAVSATTTPTKVANFKAKAASNSITLTWSKNATADKYRVYIYKGGKWERLTETTKLSYTVKNLKPNTKYNFRVFAVKGNVYGVYAAVSATTTPTKVANFKAKASSNSVTLTWSKNATANKYRVYIYKGGKWVRLTETTKLTYTAKSLKPNTKYNFRVFAVKGNVYGAYTAVSATTTPTKVANFKAKAASNSVTLTWSKNATADKYRVYIYKGGKWVRLTETPKLTYTVKSLKPNTKYNFRVFAVKGNVYGAYTAVSAMTTPTKVANFKAKAASNSVTLTWSKNATADKYRVYIYKGGKWVRLTETPKLTYTVKSLKPNTKYNFRVYPVKGNVYGAYTAVSATTTPTKVANFKAKAASNSVTLTWSKNATADKYRVYIYKGGKWVRLTETTKLTYTVKSLKPNTKYYFRVYTVKGNVYGAYTAVSAVTTPTKVANFKAKAAFNSVTLTWSKNATADKYRVYIYKGGKWVRLTETTKLSYTVKNLKPNTKYNFRVFAVKGNVYGAYTAVSATTVKKK